MDLGRVVRKPVKTNPELKFTRSIYFSSIEMFSLMFCVVLDCLNSKLRDKQYKQKPKKLQNSNQNSR